MTPEEKIDEMIEISRLIFERLLKDFSLSDILLVEEETPVSSECTFPMDIIYEKNNKRF